MDHVFVELQKTLFKVHNLFPPHLQFSHFPKPTSGPNWTLSQTSFGCPSPYVCNPGLDGGSKREK